jgi:NADH-quinone oxidoreductase subunit E
MTDGERDERKTTESSSAQTAPQKAAIHPAALAAMANAGLVAELEARGTGKPLTADELARIKSEMQLAALKSRRRPEEEG